VVLNMGFWLLAPCAVMLSQGGCRLGIACWLAATVVFGVLRSVRLVCVCSVAGEGANNPFCQAEWPTGHLLITTPCYY
jgi:hypothetical protein